ncbi:MAG: anti-sigma factor family protein [Telluria sp.]
MNYTDDILMAYADGELDAGTRQSIEQAMRDDPAVAARVQDHKALRALAATAFAETLQEPVPERLAMLVQPQVAQLADARAARERRTNLRRWSWAELGGMAAALVIGVLSGHVLWQREAPLATRNGVLVAEGSLAAALSNQLASDRPGDVNVGVSFLGKDGNYCRTFTYGATAGLACRADGRWTLPVVAEAPAQDTAYRQAGSTLPTAVLDEMDERIDGSALDRDAERQARERGWTPLPK